MAAVLHQRRWSSLTRRMHIVLSLAFVAALFWWLIAGDIFQTESADAGARGGIALMVLFIVVGLAYKLYR